jgi:NAD(P)H-hydrate repair Nnr-like enzyme with NAD(P)H-hydrate dehydratase domain
VIIESSFLVTTSSGQGDKSKTEYNIRKLIRKYYPAAKFVGFIDGIGWYVRRNDLKRMVDAYDEVFTYHRTEIKRFSDYVKRGLSDKRI